jgi:hypothetical protein
MPFFFSRLRVDFPASKARNRPRLLGCNHVNHGWIPMWLRDQSQKNTKETTI